MTTILRGSLALIVGLCPSLLWAQTVQVEGTLSRPLTLGPGDRAEGTIALRNVDTQPGNVRVYQTDYRFDAAGNAWYDEPGTQPRSNASWITCTPRVLSVAPGEQATVSYVVQVPRDDKLAGTYWSVVMVEPDSPSASPVQADGKRVALGIRTVFRYAIQISVQIGQTGKCDLQFVDKRIVIQDGKRLVQIDVTNPGERALLPTMWGEFYSAEGGQLAKRAESRRLRLYPGCTGRFQLDISELPPGKYESLIVADNGDDSVFGARYSLEIQ
jgi:P pilus assembly chaperone PapD